jgi:hypothetical protein
MAQCGGIGVLELNKLELELCRRLNWRLIPSAQQLHRLRTSLDEPNSRFWDSWRSNGVVPTAECKDVQESCSMGSSAKGRLPATRSWQDHLGRMLFGSVHLEASERPAEKVVAADPKSVPDEHPGSRGSGSPGSPRSVFRRIFAEQVFGMAS